MKILVTGSRGQLGCELKKKSTKQNFEWLFTDRENFDLSRLKTIHNFLDKKKPDLIINCAAYTHVDKAEDNLKFANILNHLAIASIAEWCSDNNRRLIHISTDYVYDGTTAMPYKENDITNPLNNYGKTKLLGDMACAKKNPTSIIIRTSRLYSSFRNNFVKKMIDLMQKNDEINVVDDQFGAPTFAQDLVNVILKIIKNKKWLPGIYNFTNNGHVSWYHFANDIKTIIGSNTNINPISSTNYISKVKRPKNSILDNSKIIKTFQIRQINYKDSLNKCIKILENES